MLEAMPTFKGPLWYPDPPPGLPKDQIERIEIILGEVLGQLRSRSSKLLAENELALTFDPRGEAKRQ
jgi:hypothetical protein